MLSMVMGNDSTLAAEGLQRVMLSLISTGEEIKSGGLEGSDASVEV